MKGLGAGLKVGFTAGLIVVFGYGAFKFIGKGLKGEDGYEVRVRFKDATGLLEKSRVQVAGIVIGEIKARTLVPRGDGDEGQALVRLKIKPEVELYSDATIYKKTSSLLGEFYLEIDPGNAAVPDPVSGQAAKHYQLRDCVTTTADPECNRIRNVIEPVSVSDVLMQVSETVPILRDILKDVQKLTQGPLQDISKEVQSGIARNSLAAERLLTHIDQIAGDIKNITSGTATDDFRNSMKNVREITEQVKKLVGTGEGQVSTTADKVKDNLDKLAQTLEKVNHSLDSVGTVTEDIAKGRGNVGRLLKDETIAENVTEVTEDVSGFIKSLTRLQTLVGIREEYNILQNSFKTYLSIKLMPKPDKYYLIELIDDPRGSKQSSHTYSQTNDPQKTGDPTGQKIIGINSENWTRTPQFRLSFMFAKRIELWHAIGITGRLGIKESTGGLGLDLDFWHQRIQLQIDLFDFAAEKYPRLKVLAAVEFFKHLWIVAGGDDLINGDGSIIKPADVTCGTVTPSTWCKGGRDVFVGLQLTFNDEDLRALLAIGGSALSSAGR